MLSDYFGGRALNKTINPDEAVAYGAAVQAAILNGAQSKTVKSMLLLDVAPLSMGIETTGGVMSVVVPRNTTIPTEKTQIFTTEFDNQTKDDVNIYEGERGMVRDCHLIGKFVLNEIVAAPKGVPKIVVTFNIDADGILEVTASDRASGTADSIRITSDKTRLSLDEIANLVAEGEKYKMQDEKLKHKIETRQGLESYCSQMVNQLTDEKMGAHFSEKDKTLIKGLTTECQTWLHSKAAENNHTVAAMFDRKQRELESKFNPIMIRVYKACGRPGEGINSK